uniref:Aryl hydrocarbon receptor n=1 Tax=Parastrongyloides trichosuri TaxID=131310 RepID=A0A0N4Z736_PARTI
MYASKRRQRNFKRLRETVKPSTTSNPSKRHRERLNGELETIANLLPYEQGIITRLDKLSVLRLAVSYLQIKAHFQTTFLHPTITGSEWLRYINLWNPTIPVGPIPSLLEANSLTPLCDPKENSFNTIATKALGGFILILNENGDINYASENIDQFLGFHQSDILHQPIFDMIHSEDREDIRMQLNIYNKYSGTLSSPFDLLDIENGKYLGRNVSARFRCLLDNTCGFVRVDIKGKLIPFFGPHMQIINSHMNSENLSRNKFALAAICCPFVPPLHVDEHIEDPILKSKHSLDFSIVSMDERIKGILEIDSNISTPLSFYSLCHPEDASCLAEAHREVTKSAAAGILIYRLIGQKTGSVYWFQSSCRMFLKNGKPESIGLTHRMLNEVEGTNLLDKRSNLKTKLLSFDESLLQSPRNLQSAQALPKMIKAIQPSNDNINKKVLNNISKKDILVQERNNSNTFGGTTFYPTTKVEAQPIYTFNPQYISSTTGIINNDNNYYQPIQYPISMPTHTHIYHDNNNPLYNSTTSIAVQSLLQQQPELSYHIPQEWPGPSIDLTATTTMEPYHFPSPHNNYHVWSTNVNNGTTSYDMPRNIEYTTNFLKETSTNNSVDKFQNTIDFNPNHLMINGNRTSNTNSLSGLSFISELSNTLFT